MLCDDLLPRNCLEHTAVSHLCSPPASPATASNIPVRGAMRILMYLLREVKRQRRPSAVTQPIVKVGIKKSAVGAGFEL